MHSPYKNDPLEKILKIYHVSAAYRTLDETTTYSEFLSNFDFFKSKVLDNSLPEVLNLATKHLKYAKIPAGQFLYHHGQPSNCIYLILKGEAWKFRYKTEQEFELDLVLKQKKANGKNVPKILETIQLAKAQLARNKVQVTIPATTTKASTANGSERSPKLARGAGDSTPRSPKRPGPIKDLQIEIKQSEFSRFIREDNRFEPNSAKLNSASKFNNNVSAPEKKKIGESLLQKLKGTAQVMNFENDYLFNLIKRNQEMTTRYINDKNFLLKFEKKFGMFDTLGEMSMSLNQIRTSSVLAYTDLHIFYLDQKSYEKVFFAQIEEIKEKLDYFTGYFKEINFNTLKRLCFLFTEKKFKLGETIYKEGSPCDNLYFIKSGEVQLVKKLTVEDIFHSAQNTETDLNVHSTPTNKVEKNVLVASVRDGHFFGEETLSREPTRNFTAKSMSYLTCYVVIPQVLSRLPAGILQNLRDMSVSKRNWRGDRIEDIKNQPLFKNIQKNLTLNSLYREQKGGKSPRHNSTDNNLEKSLSQDHRNMTERTPKRTLDLSSTEYGFFIKKNIPSHHHTDSSKTEEPYSKYKLPTSKLNLENRNTIFHDRSALTSRGGRKNRLMISLDNQRTIEALKYSLHPSSSRSQSKRTPKDLEAKSYSESDESKDNNNPAATQILPSSEPIQDDENEFEFNFVTKMNKTKKSTNVNKKQETGLDEKSRGMTAKSAIRNQENRRETSRRTIVTPNSQMMMETNFRKLKGSLVNLMSRDKTNPYYQDSLDTTNYFMIKTCNSYQGQGLSSLKVIDDSKYLSPRDESPATTKIENSVSLQNKMSNMTIKNRSQILHVQGSKVKGVY